MNHGSLSSYRRGGCRCDDCRAAATDARRRLRTNAGAVNPHVRAARRLAEATQVSRTWVNDAACLGTDPDVFFTAKRGGDETFTEARKVCAGCPVIAECLTFGESSAETREYGIWGGLSPDERRRLRRRRVS